jgi:hypothetical protein
MYRLRIPTIGVRNDNGKWVTIKMPAEAVIEVADEDPAKGTVDVMWNDLRIRMFTIDLQERGDVLERNPRKLRASVSST